MITFLDPNWPGVESRADFVAAYERLWRVFAEHPAAYLAATVQRLQENSPQVVTVEQAFRRLPSNCATSLKLAGELQQYNQLYQIQGRLFTEESEAGRYLWRDMLLVETLRLLFDLRGLTKILTKAEGVDPRELPYYIDERFTRYLITRGAEEEVDELELIGHEQQLDEAQIETEDCEPDEA